MKMRRSKTLAKLRQGGLASCTKINLNDPRAVEIASMCGFDCIWIDREHTPGTFLSVENMVRAAKVHDVDMLVRVSKGSYSDMVVPLECDATGIMVPHVMSLTEAKAIARTTKFHPIGRRPLDGGNADGAYCMLPGTDYIKQANEERFVAIQIEDPEPLDELEEIAAVPGLEMLFFGPADFTQGIGAPLQFDDPRFIKARSDVAAAALRHGKIAGTVGNAANLNQLVDLGYRFISIGADVTALAAYFEDCSALFSGVNLKIEKKGVYSK